MAGSMKTRPTSAGDEEPVALAGLSVVGRMIITCHDTGTGMLVPEITFDPVGRINQGWFDRYQNHFQRAIQRAQVQQRNKGEE